MTVYLMRGRIGSGKTYTGQRLCEENGGQLLSVDDLTGLLFGSKCPGREGLVATETAILSYFLKLAAENAAAGRCTVIDHGFWRLSDLDAAVSFLQGHAIPYEVITVEADFDTRLARVNARENGKQFDREKLLKLDHYYEEIGKNQFTYYIPERIIRK